MQSLESDKGLVTACHGMGMAICVQSVSIDFELHTYIIHSQYYTLVKHDRGRGRDRIYELLAMGLVLLVGISTQMLRRYLYGIELSPGPERTPTAHSPGN